MIGAERVAEIRRLFFAEHWKIGTIASELGLHAETVRLSLETDRFNHSKTLRTCLTDSYIGFIKATLERYPALRATRIYEMLRERGFVGSERAVRRTVERLRLPAREAFLRLSVLPGEQGQVDWAHFGKVQVGRAERRLSCFVMVLSYSRALYLEFFFDQSLPSFLAAHVNAFEDLGVPRILLYDNLRSAVLARQGSTFELNPRLHELAAHYHFQARFCSVGRGNEKGRVERAIQYVRHSFFAARSFTTLADFNRKALKWRDEIAHQRAWPSGDHRTVNEAWQEERPRLLPLAQHRPGTDLMIQVRSQKTPYIRFDLNDYSIPPEVVGRPLTLLASGSSVRLLDGASEVARHPRSFDRHERVENPAHIEALLRLKGKADGLTRANRLVAAVPLADAFLSAAVERGESLSRLTDKLTRLLSDYGEDLLTKALQEALEKGTPNASSVAYLLQRLMRTLKRRPPLPVSISKRPELADLVVSPHDARSYDALHAAEEESHDE
ncbi:MAG: IS21 family transposase [Dehalococcoidia bacterium]|nr:MAG: IS21 family transposase [Dehalococcoidia bacterium]